MSTREGKDFLLLLRRASSFECSREQSIDISSASSTALRSSLDFYAFLLLIMSVINEDLLWLQSLVFPETNSTMIDATLSYRWQAPASTLSLVSNSSSMATVLLRPSSLVVLKWSVRLIGGLLIIVGGIGNTLSACTLSRKKLRAQVTSIYLIALALSDLGMSERERERERERECRVFIRYRRLFRECLLQRLELLPDPLQSQSQHASAQQSLL